MTARKSTVAAAAGNAKTVAGDGATVRRPLPTPPSTPPSRRRRRRSVGGVDSASVAVGITTTSLEDEAAYSPSASELASGLRFSSNPSSGLLPPGFAPASTQREAYPSYGEDYSDGDKTRSPHLVNARRHPQIQQPPQHNRERSLQLLSASLKSSPAQGWTPSATISPFDYLVALPSPSSAASSASSASSIASFSTAAIPDDSPPLSANSSARTLSPPAAAPVVHANYLTRSEEPSSYTTNGNGKKTPSLARGVSLSLSARASNAVAGLSSRRRAAGSATPAAIGLDAEQVNSEGSGEADTAATVPTELAVVPSRQNTVKATDRPAPSTMAATQLEVRDKNSNQDGEESKIGRDFPTVRIDDVHAAQIAPVSRKGRIRTSSRAAARASELFRSFVHKQFPATVSHTTAAVNTDGNVGRSQHRVEVVTAAVVGPGPNEGGAKKTEDQGSSHIRAKSAAATSRAPATGVNDANFSAGTDALAATAARHGGRHSLAKNDELLLQLDRGDARAAAPISHPAFSALGQPRRSSVSRLTSDGKEQEVIDLRFIPSAGSWYALLGLTYEMSKIPRQQQAVPPPTGVELPEVPDATTPRMNTREELADHAQRYAEEEDADTDSLSDASPMTPKPAGAPPSSHLTLPIRRDAMGRSKSVDSNASQDTAFFSVAPSSAGSNTPPRRMPPPRMPKSQLRHPSESLSSGHSSFPDSPLLYSYADANEKASHESLPGTAERRRSSLTPANALALVSLARRQHQAIYAAAAVSSPTRSTFSQPGSMRSTYGPGHEVVVVRTKKRPVSLDGALNDQKQTSTTAIEWTCIARRQRSNTGTCVCGRGLRAIQYVTRGGVRVAPFPVCSRCAAARETIRRGGCAKTLPVPVAMPVAVAMDPNATQVPFVAVDPKTGAAWIVPALAPSPTVMPVEPITPTQQPSAVSAVEDGPKSPSLSIPGRGSSFISAVQAARSSAEQISSRQREGFEHQRFSSMPKPSLFRTDSATDPMLAPASPLTKTAHFVTGSPREMALRPSAMRTNSEFEPARQGPPPPRLLRHNGSASSLRHDYHRRAVSVERGGTRSAASSPVVQAWNGSTSLPFGDPLVFEDKTRERAVSFVSFTSETSSASGSTNDSRSTVASPRVKRFSDLPSSDGTLDEAVADDDDAGSTKTDATTVTNGSRASTSAVDLAGQDQKSISAQIRLDSKHYRISSAF